jgi:hypothetical protein
MTRFAKTAGLAGILVAVFATVIRSYRLQFSSTHAIYGVRCGILDGAGY